MSEGRLPTLAESGLPTLRGLVGPGEEEPVPPGLGEARAGRARVFSNSGMHVAPARPCRCKVQQRSSSRGSCVF
jgi:hypothetical protein